jgi:hypothetical protein
MRRTIWKSDRWGIEFHLEVMHRTIGWAPFADSVISTARTGSARIQGAFWRL